MTLPEKSAILPTIGRSNMFRKAPRTAVFELRTDYRYLATIAEYLDSVNLLPKTKSELGHTIVELLAETLIENKKARRIVETQEAQQVLDFLGLGSANRTGRGVSDLVRQHEVEDALNNKPSFNKEEKATEVADILKRLQEGEQ